MKSKLLISGLIIVMLFSCRKEEKQYFPNGMVKAIYTVKDGKKNGQYKEYYSSGALYIVANYKNGLLQGEEKVFYENGRLKKRSHYLNNKYFGIQEYFNVHGGVDSVHSCVMINYKYLNFGRIKNYSKFIDSYFDKNDTAKNTGINKYLVFDKSGHVVPEKSHWFTITLAKDTIQLSDSLNINLFFPYRFNDKKNIFLLYIFTSDLMDKLNIYKRVEYVNTFKMKPNHTGVNYLKGYIEEYTPYGDDTIQTIMFFTEKYYVK